MGDLVPFHPSADNHCFCEIGKISNRPPAPRTSQSQGIGNTLKEPDRVRKHGGQQGAQSTDNALPFNVKGSGKFVAFFVC